MLKIPPPTRGTIKEVVTELDCMIAVMIIPQKKLVAAVLKRYLSNIVWIFASMRRCIESHIIFREEKRRIRAKIMAAHAGRISRITSFGGPRIKSKGLPRVVPAVP